MKMKTIINFIQEEEEGKTDYLEEVQVFLNANKYYSALTEINRICRNEVKHGESEEVAKFAERIQEAILEEDIYF